MYFSEISRLNENNIPLVDVKDLEKMSIEEYDFLINNIWNDLLDDLSLKNNIVKIMFTPKNTFEFTVSRLIIQMVYWRVNITLKIPIEVDDIYDCSDLTKGKIHGTIETIDKKLLNNPNIKVSMDDLGEIDAQIIEKLMKISETWAKVTNSTISLYDIIRLKKRNPEIRKIIDTRISDDLSLKEIEQEIVEKRKRLSQLIIEDNKSCLVNYLKTGRFDLAQLGQMMCNIGSRADSNKFILPVPIHGNFLNGLENTTDYFIESITGRDAMITKDKYVAISGALSRKIDLVCLTTDIDHSVEDCGTTHCLEVFVENENILNIIHEKYMVNEDLSLHAIDKDKDKHLIGTTIYVRSHICCALTEDKVCKTCYGAKSPRLEGTNIGGLPSIKCVNLISQRAMSQKHKTTTNATVVKNDALEKFFFIENSRCFIREDADISNVVLMVDKDYLEEAISNSKESVSDYEDENTSEYENSLQLENVKIRDRVWNKATKSYDEIEYELEDSNMFLLLSNELMEKKELFNISISDEYAHLPLSKIEQGSAVFDLLLITEEVSLYLKQLLSTINGGNRTRNYASYNSIMADLIDIVDRTGMYISINHLETIIYNLLKDKGDIKIRPDFSQEIVEYVIEPLDSALMLKDIYTSMGCGYHKRQLTNLTTFEKNKKGIYDSFFKTKESLIKEY